MSFLFIIRPKRASIRFGPTVGIHHMLDHVVTSIGKKRNLKFFKYKMLIFNNRILIDFNIKEIVFITYHHFQENISLIKSICIQTSRKKKLYTK